MVEDKNFSGNRNSDRIPDTGKKPIEANETIISLYGFVEWLSGIILLVILVLSFCLRTVNVSGASMMNTLHDGDKLATTRLLGAPKNGDIVAIGLVHNLHKPLIKRVIAVEGQTIDIDFISGTVTVDGAVLEEEYISERTHDSYDIVFPMVVPAGCVFVMGDNRNNSWDSRSSEIGMIDTRNIIGKALFRFAPLDRLGVL